MFAHAAAGGDIASTFDHPEATKLGHCKLIEEIMIGEDRLIHFSGVAKAEACTIVLRGASACYSIDSPSAFHILHSWLALYDSAVWPGFHASRRHGLHTSPAGLCIDCCSKRCCVAVKPESAPHDDHRLHVGDVAERSCRMR